MGELTTSRIEPTADPNSAPQDQSARKPLAKSAVPEKAASTKEPEIGAPGLDEIHELDEMA